MMLNMYGWLALAARFGSQPDGEHGIGRRTIYVFPTTFSFYEKYWIWEILSLVEWYQGDWLRIAL